MIFSEFMDESTQYFKRSVCNKANIIHGELLNIMEAFHDVCMKNSIPYFMGFGTLLGAKRDGGLIPWDFDVDLLVKYSDKIRLIEALKKDLMEGFAFECLEVDPQYEHFDMRIYKKGTHHQILHVDIFYLLDAPDGECAFKSYGRKLIRLSKIRHAKLTDVSLTSGAGKMALIRAKLLRAKYFCIPLSYLNWKHKKLCEKYVSKNTNTYFRTCLHERNLKCMYPKKWFGQTRLLAFNGHEFCAPMCAEDMLTMFYKDYNKYPPIEERFFELVNRVANFDDYCKRGLSDLW